MRKIWTYVGAVIIKLYGHYKRIAKF